MHSGKPKPPQTTRRASAFHSRDLSSGLFGAPTRSEANFRRCQRVINYGRTLRRISSQASHPIIPKVAPLDMLLVKYCTRSVPDTQTQGN